MPRTRDSLVGLLAPGDLSGELLTIWGVHSDVAARDECANLARASALAGIYAAGQEAIAIGVTNAVEQYFGADVGWTTQPYRVSQP